MMILPVRRNIFKSTAGVIGGFFPRHNDGRLLEGRLLTDAWRRRPHGTRDFDRIGWLTVANFMIRYSNYIHFDCFTCNEKQIS